MAQLELKNVTKKFGDFYAANNISFTAEEGEFVTLLGPSGCGKTSLLKLIAGFHLADEGDIIIGGKRINDVPPERRNTAMCFQSYALFPHLNVAHNICYGLQQKKVPINEQRNRLEIALKQMDLEIQKLKLPSQLSGGQQQRVALARAMVTRPDVILFDEPLSNLDAKLRESVRFEIKQLSHQYNLTSVYVTHDQAEALSMSDKIIVLNKGSIEQIGTPQDIYYCPKNRFIADFIGVANIVKAQVKSLGDDLYAVQSVLGDFVAKSSIAPQAEHIYICFRPEDAQPCDDPTQENYFSVDILQSAFMGNMTEVQGQVSRGTQSQKIRLQLSNFGLIEGHNRLSFCLAREAIHFLEAVEDD